MLDLARVKLPGKPIFTFKTFLQVDWPHEYLYKGRMYLFTQKEGYRNKDRCPSAEYKLLDIDFRIWVDLDGHVLED